MLNKARGIYEKGMGTEISSGWCCITHIILLYGCQNGAEFCGDLMVEKVTADMEAKRVL